MTSRRRVEANRRNAQASTGPNTVSGRRRAARNAHRHGLSVSVPLDPTRADDIEQLTRMIAATGRPDAETWARPIAEAQIDLVRVHEARRLLLSGDYPDESAARARYTTPSLTLEEILEEAEQEMESFRKYPRRIMKGVLAQMFPPQSRLLGELSKLLKRLGALDRYEQAALGRRKRAIRAFNAPKPLPEFAK